MYIQKLIFSFALASLGILQVLSAQNQQLNGYILEAATKEPIPYASIRQKDSKQGTLTNAYGYFSIKVGADKASALRIEAVGYQSLELSFDESVELPLKISLELKEGTLDSVVIESEKISSGPGVSNLTPAFLESIPTFLGERDVIKALQYLPGVQRANDGNSSLHVRGGNGDQNLILLDEAPIYNVNHLFGFFSVFNGDAIQSIEFIKGGFPAHYGGRLSSVVSVTTREGSREKWGAKASVALSSAQLTVEGPLLNKKASILLSARRTYWDAVIRPILTTAQNNSRPFFFFHDYNAKFTYDINPKNKLIASAYTSRDRYGTKDLNNLGSTRNGFNWQNLTSNIRWNHIISPKAFINTSVFLTSYQVALFNEGRVRRDNRRGRLEASTGSGIVDLAVKHDFYLYPSSNHALRFGGVFFQHWFTPNRQVLIRDNYFVNVNGDINQSRRESYSTQEMAAFVEDRWKIGSKFILDLGFRYSAYLAEGEWQTNYEPRFKLIANPSPKQSVEVSLTRMAQYIHQVSNSGLALPIDVWVPSTDRIVPQSSWQAAMGWKQSYPDLGIDVIVEGYYKSLENVVSYQEAASFFNLDLDNLDTRPLDWQNLITQGDGTSYGAELLFNRKVGKHKSMLSYSFSRTTYTFEDLNQGIPFAPRFDRRHMLSLLHQWKINRRLELNVGWFFSTGNPVPLPLALALFEGHEEVIPPGNSSIQAYSIFSRLDQFRNPLYHRLDASLKIKAKKKNRKWNWNYYWEVGAYNLYNRLNPSFYSLASEEDPSTQTTTFLIQKNSLIFFTPSISFHASF